MVAVGVTDRGSPCSSVQRRRVANLEAAAPPPLCRSSNSRRAGSLKPCFEQRVGDGRLAQFASSQPWPASHFRMRSRLLRRGDGSVGQLGDLSAEIPSAPRARAKRGFEQIEST